MNTIIPRKVYEPGGFAYMFFDGKCKPLPRHVAQLERNNRNELIEVTWSEVMAARRKRQAEDLNRIRHVGEDFILPCYVWTFFNRQSFPYHGWYCYVVTRHFSIGVNFRGLKEELATSIMSAFPLGMLPMVENFTQWMRAFAEAYPRKQCSDPRKSGTRTGWISNRRTFTVERPKDNS